MKGLCESARCCQGARNPNAGQERLTHVRGPDRRAFRELVEKLRSKVSSLTYALLGDAKQADEAAQKVFVTIHRKHYIDQQRDDIRWVYQLAIDQCLAAMRTRRLRKFFMGLIGRPSSWKPTELTGSTVESHLLRALSRVTDKERALLVLREVADQPVEDIAAIMRMDRSAVLRRLFVARKRLLAVWSSSAEN
jgi:RNA polymerase sigma-70 factor (ECF subfamily)